MLFEQDISVVESWLYGRPKRTQQAYLKDIEQLFAWLNRPMADVLLPDLQDYQAHLFNHCRQKESTVSRKLNAVRSLFRFAHEQGLIAHNPTLGLRSPKVVKHIADRVLSREQVQSIFDAANEGRDRAMLRFIYATGCRISEACGLVWKDCTEKPDHAVVRLLGKGSKWRSVKLPRSVWADVAALKTEDATDLDPVFGIGPRHASRIMKDAVHKSGVNSEASMHWLRHSNASHAIEAGAPLPVVRDSLGHSSIAVTDIYAHSNPEQSSSDYLGL